MPVVTRYAPSPTGLQHVGGARTALFNYAYARRWGGRFLLRIEDTDRKRSTAEAERGILDDLKWLGLDWDNAGDEPRQSERLDLYEQHFARLAEAGRTYEDDGAVRFRMPGRDITVHDQVLGDVTTPADKLEDFVIRKSDGYPTYHFAVVVDDATMEVTHVIRGQEHLGNTPKHIALQEALGLATPSYAHIPLIFNPDGSKMSKRDKAKAARAAAKDATETCPLQSACPPDELRAFLEGDTDDLGVARAIARTLDLKLPEIDVSDFRGSGYMPEVLCNYLALLGWNPGGDVEQFDLAFLCERFDFDRVGSSAAKFDREKLAAFNADAIAQMPPEALVERVWKYGHEALSPTFGGPEDARFRGFCEAYRERSKTLRDPLEQGAFFFMADAAIEYDFAAKPIAKVMKGDAFEVLAALRERLAGLAGAGFGAAAHEAVKQLAEEKGVGMGKVAQPLRVAISGGTVTPPIDATLDILGKGSTLARIDHCLAASGR